MSSDDSVTAGSGQFLFDGVVAGGEDEAIDLSDAAMDHREAAATDFKVEAARQRCHPNPALSIDVAVDIGVPLAGEGCARAVGGKPAPATSRLGREGFLAIPHDQPDARLTHEVDYRLWVCTIGRKIACAHDVARRNPASARLVEDSGRRLDVAVRAPENEHWAREVNEAAVTSNIVHWGHGPGFLPRNRV